MVHLHVAKSLPGCLLLTSETAKSFLRTSQSTPQPARAPFRPGFAQLYGAYADALAKIGALGLKQGRRKTGLTEDKGAARLALCRAANKLAGAVAAHAHVAGNNQLLTRVATTLSILLAGRGQDSSDKCRDILAAASTKPALNVLPHENETNFLPNNTRRRHPDAPSLGRARLRPSRGR